MPRKVGIGPAILRIEGLSTGKDPLAVDEFDGSPLAQPYAKPPKTDNAQAARDAMNRAKRERAKVLLDTYMPSEPKLVEQVELIPKGYRKRGEIGGKAILRKMPPWMKI